MSSTRQLTNTTSGSFDELLVRSPATGPYQNILSLIGSGGGGGSYDDTQVRADIATNAAGISNNATATSTNASAILAKASQTQLAAGLALKQDALGAGDLAISVVNGLQAALDGKVDDSQVLTNVPANAVFTDTLYAHPPQHSISDVSGLQSALDGKVDDSQVLTNVPAGAVFTDTVTNQISQITGLQAALDGKVDDSQVLTNVPANALFTDTLYVHPPQHSISDVAGLQADLNSRATTTALTAGLAGKQNLLGIGDLSIGITSGLQTALDAKVDDSQVLTNVPANALFSDTIYVHPPQHSISDVSGLQSALDGKVDDSQVLTNVPANALFSDTIYVHPPQHSISDVSGLQSALDAKANDGDLLAIQGGNGFQTISQLTVYNANTTISGTSAFVTPDALEVYSGSAWLATRALKFTNCSVVSQGSSTPVHLEVTPDWPTIAQVESGALTTALAGKQASLQVKGSTSSYLPITKFNFANSEVALGAGSGELVLTSQPNIADVGFTYGSTTGGGGYSASSGSINTSTTTTNVTTSLRFGTTGHAYPQPAGATTSTSGCDAVYDIPAASRGGSIWITHQLNSNGGYFDVELGYSGYTTGDEYIWYRRVNAYSPIGYQRSDGPNHTEYAGQRLECVASGYAPHFDKLKIRGREGRWYIVAVSFSPVPYNDCGNTDWIHSSNVIGDPASLSDSRIKQNQQPADQAALCSVFDALVPKTYDRQDNAEMTPECRLGLIADDVKAALNTHLPQVTNVISERPVGEGMLLALDYSRLCCPLIAKIRQLEARLAALEST